MGKSSPEIPINPKQKQNRVPGRSGGGGEPRKVTENHYLPLGVDLGLGFAGLGFEGVRVRSVRVGRIRSPRTKARP